MDKETEKLLERANFYNLSVKPAPKRNFLTSLLPTAGGIIGGIAGSFAAPGIGTAAGGAGGSILGELLAQKLSGEADDGIDKGNLLEEGAFGTLGGIGKAAKSIRGASSVFRAGEGIGEAANILRTGVPTVGKVAKGGLLAKLGGKLERSGDNLLGTQANLTRAETRQLGRGLNPATVLGDINKRTGLTSMESMANVGSNVTGKEGVFNELRKNAIGNTKGVDIGDLRNVADDLLLDKAPLITGNKRTSVLDSVKNNIVKSYGGSKGSLSKLADPYEAFDAASKFDAMAADLTRGATVSAADRQLASVYKGLSKTINNRLFSADGVAEGLQLAKPQAKEALLALAKTAPRKEASAYTALAKELDAITDVPGLRKAQSSFVNLGKIDEATANARAGAGAALGGQMQGAGKLVQRPTNLLAMPLDAATPAIGGALSKGGSILQSLGGGGAKAGGSGTIPGLLKMQGLRGAMAVMGGGQPQQAEAAPVDPMTGAPLGAASALGGSPEMMGGSQMGMGTPQQPQSMYSREAAAQDIQRDLQATGGKNMDKYMALWEFLNPQVDEKSTKLSEGQQARSDLITSLGMAGNIMDQGSINYGPIGSRVEGIKSIFNAADPETMSYKNVIGQVRGAITKARAGASLTEGELKLLDTYTPKDTDSEQVVRSKLEQLNNLYGSSAPTGGGLAAEDILSQLQAAY